MKSETKNVLLGLFFLSICHLSAQDTISYLWEINSLTSIGGHSLTVKGNPKVVDSDQGQVVEFDGNGDQLLIDANPVGSSKEFTIEVIFKPASGSVNQANQPRFIHIQDPDDADQKRILMEIRVNTSNKVYMDGFMKTDSDDEAVIDETKTHDTDIWQHMAITYKNDTLSNYFNGIFQGSGKVTYTTDIVNEIGKTAIGGRMDERNYYQGQVKALKVTHAKLSPEKFMSVETVDPVNITSVSSSALKVYPVPAKDRIFINLPIGVVADKAVFYALTGKVAKEVMPETNHSNVLEINVNDLTKGYYIIKIMAGERYFSGKLIISE